MMRFVVGCLLVGVFAGEGRADGPVAPLDKLWTDLAGKDEGKATRAALVLARSPGETVAYLAKALKPVKLEGARFDELLKKLDDDDFNVRENAYQELEYQGKTIRAQLEKLLEGKPSVEVRNQINRLIEASYCDEPLPPQKANPAGIGGGSISITTIGGKRVIKIDGKEIDTTPKMIEMRGPQAAWVRAARATAVLEYIGTPEARTLLKSLAAGEAEALPTKAAREALERLK